VYVFWSIMPLFIFGSISEICFSLMYIYIYILYKRPIHEICSQSGYILHFDGYLSLQHSNIAMLPQPVVCLYPRFALATARFARRRSCQVSTLTTSRSSEPLFNLVHGEYGYQPLNIWTKPTNM